MPVRTKRWNAPADPDDGLRVLVCRYRPRGLPKAKETWDVWMRDLGPSPDLFDSFFGKKGKTPIPLSDYLARYETEMEAQRDKIRELAERVRAGATITLLCSKDCILPEACHRTRLAKLIEGEASK
jgi:uncharacterized protein YeaO (DUF488 family)